MSYELSLGSALLSLGVFTCGDAGKSSLNFAALGHTEAFFPVCALFLICTVGHALCVRLQF